MFVIVHKDLEKPTILNFVIRKFVLIPKIFMAFMKRALTHNNKNDSGGPKGESVKIKTPVQ